MKKGISIYYGFKTNPEDNIKEISKAGFDCVMTIAEPRFNKDNGNIDEQMKLFKKYNLSVCSLHQKYENSELPDFWLDTKIGDKVEESLKEDVLIAAKYNIPCVVVHLLAMEIKNYEIGFKRLERVLKVCEEVNVPLAIENIDDPPVFFATMERFKDHPYVKMCYDSGHNNFVDPKTDYLTLFCDKIICLHLHDNMGVEDDHTLNKYGNIDWDNLAKKLAKISNELVLTYELSFYKPITESREEMLNEAFKQALELEEKIKYYKSL